MSQKPKILILNGSHSEIPLINAAQALGFHVVTTGNSPDLIGHSFADEYYPADYSDQRAILTLAQNLSITAICACANDFAAITAAYVAEEMGLPGHDSFDTTVLLHHKDKFKEFAQLHDLPSPVSRSFSSAEEAVRSIEQFNFPAIIKPTDMTGGKGVAKVCNKSEYFIAIQQAFDYSREKRIVVEEFFSGTQHSLSSFLVNQKVVFAFSDNEFSWLNPYFVSSSAAPADNIKLHSLNLTNAVEKIAFELSLADGIFHIQYLVDAERATIIDITRRCSGDMYPGPVSYSTGIDWGEWIVKAEAGLSCKDFPTVKQSGFCGRHCVMSDRNGTICNVHISDEIKPYLFDSIFWWKTGDVIDNYLLQKVGVVFLKYDSMSEMLEITKRLPELISIEIAQESR